MKLVEIKEREVKLPLEGKKSMISVYVSHKPGQERRKRNGINDTSD